MSQVWNGTHTPYIHLFKTMIHNTFTCLLGVVFMISPRIIGRIRWYCSDSFVSFCTYINIMLYFHICHHMTISLWILKKFITADVNCAGIAKYNVKLPFKGLQLHFIPKNLDCIFIISCWYSFYHINERCGRIQA